MKTKKKKHSNGSKPERQKTVKARDKVLKEAKKIGVISSSRACKIGGFEQAWYHLQAMVKAGDLKHAGYNQWIPVKRRGRPRLEK